MSALHVNKTFSDIRAWVASAGQAINELIKALASYLPLTGGTLTGDLSVPDEAYGVGWNGSLEVPTKNALYDKIETISGGGVSDGDKGDITVSGTGAVWTIDNDVVTYGKVQNVSATSRFLGRISSGAGDIEELTAANAKTILALAQADISGLTTADSPQFTALNVGHASDTTLARSGAGDLTIEGNAIYRAGGTDVPVADGGTGASTAAGAATNLGLGTGDSPQFTAVNVGHASDTTVTRVSAGVIAVKGVNVLTDLGVFHVQDQKASGSDGGTFTSGAWQTRTLNTTVLNTISSASLSSNQISLPAGTYEVHARAPGFRVTHHQAKLVNVTDTADLLLGSTEFVATSTNNGASNSIVQGRFTLSGTKTIELQHRCFTTLATTGFGSGSGNNWGTVVFADVLIKRIA